MDARKSVIFGIGELAQVLHYHIAKSSPAHVVAFTCDSDYINAETLNGLPVVDINNIEQLYPPESYGMYIGVGYSAMNQHRATVFDKMKARGYDILNFIHPTAHVECTDLGEGSLVFQNVIIDCFSSVGTGNVFYANSFIAHGARLGNFNFVSVCACVAGNVNIGNHCFIGANATIRDSVQIADYTLVGAGVCARKNTNQYDVVVEQRSYALENKKSIDFL